MGKRKRKRGGVSSGSLSDSDKPCPCKNGLSYGECCEPYHRGEATCEDALVLIRARFSAYAMEEIDFIIDTTHPESPEYELDRKAWARELLSFARKTSFSDLEIEQVELDDVVSWVTYSAQFEQPEQEASINERGRFELFEESWRYVGAE